MDHHRAPAWSSSPVSRRPRSLTGGRRHLDRGAFELATGVEPASHAHTKGDASRKRPAAVDRERVELVVSCLQGRCPPTWTNSPFADRERIELSSGGSESPLCPALRRLVGESNPSHSGDNRAAPQAHHEAAGLLAVSRTRPDLFRKQAPASGGTRRWGERRGSNPRILRPQRSALPLGYAHHIGQRGGNCTRTTPARTAGATAKHYPLVRRRGAAPRSPALQTGAITGLALCAQS
jgi:hypothetical protein